VTDDLRAGIEALRARSVRAGGGYARAVYVVDADALDALLAAAHAFDPSTGEADADGKALPAGLCYVCQQPASAHLLAAHPVQDVVTFETSLLDPVWLTTSSGRYTTRHAAHPGVTP